MVSFVLEQFNFGARTIFIGGAKFPKGVFRGAVYPKDIWHGDATYPRIFTGGWGGGVPKIGSVEYPMTPDVNTMISLGILITLATGRVNGIHLESWQCVIRQ